MTTDPLLNKIESAAFPAVLAVYLIATAFYFVFVAAKKEKAGVFAYRLMSAGFIAHTFCIAVRGVNAGRLPLTNQYEFAMAFAWGIALCFLIFVKKYDFNALGCFACFTASDKNTVTAKRRCSKHCKKPGKTMTASRFPNKKSPNSNRRRTP